MRKRIEAGQASMQEPSTEQLAALVAFAQNHGRCWKAKLRSLWETGRYGSVENAHLLQQIRNQFGPRFLIQCRAPK